MLLHECTQRSPEWWALRIGIPTASEFSKLVTSKGAPSKSAQDYALELAGEVYANEGEIDAWAGNQYTERGKGLEDEAIAFYEFMNDTQVERVGFVTDDDQRMGCSPDGLVSADGMVEVKCLIAKNHIKAILYHKRNDRSPPAYRQQTQGGMMICEREWCDLIFYHPKLPTLVVRQFPDLNLWHELKMQIEHLEEHRDLVVTALRDGKDAPPSVDVGPAATLTEMHDEPPVF